MSDDEVKPPDAPTEESPQRGYDPRFPETQQKADPDASWGDWLLHPTRPLRSRHKLLARYSALGKTNNEIAELLDYSVGRVSVLLSNSRIRQEVDLYRDKLYDRDLAQAFKELLPDAIYALEDIVRHESVTLKDKVAKESAARFIVEKLDGKAAQKINVEHGSLDRFMELMRDMQERGEVLDITPPAKLAPPVLSAEKLAEGPPSEATEAPPNYDDWLKENF